jgi:hypothetical protein
MTARTHSVHDLDNMHDFYFNEQQDQTHFNTGLNENTLTENRGKNISNNSSNSIGYMEDKSKKDETLNEYTHSNSKSRRLLTIIAAFVFLTFASTFLTWLWIIPYIVQQMVDNPPLDTVPSATHVEVKSANVAFDSSTVYVQSQIVMSKNSAILATLTLGDMIIDITDSSKQTLTQLFLQGPITLYSDKDSNLNIKLNIMFQNSKISALQDFITTVSNQESNYVNGRIPLNGPYTNQTLFANMKVPVQMFGISIYSALPITKTIDLNALMAYALAPTDQNRRAAKIPKSNPSSSFTIASKRMLNIKPEF